MPSGKQSKLDGELARLCALPLKEVTPYPRRACQAPPRARAARTRRPGEEPAQAKRRCWLSNQLVRERELDVQGLLKAGESLSKAQKEAACGASAEAFGDARREEQRALEQLAQVPGSAVGTVQGLSLPLVVTDALAGGGEVAASASHSASVLARRVYERPLRSRCGR